MQTLLARLRRQRPLVHCLTNPVAASLTANALLCFGASPLMAEAEAEMADAGGFTDALLVNLGMQSPPRMAAARLAVARARQRSTPWVLDPVAAGAIGARTALAAEFTACGPRVIKGNASEIMALAGLGAGGRGVDARDETEAALPAARALARQSGAVVAITGAVDLVVDADRVRRIPHGHPLMARISGLGCAAGALIAACCAVEPDGLAAAAGALALLGRAGARAAVTAQAPGTLVPALLDALFNLDDDAEPDGV